MIDLDELTTVTRVDVRSSCSDLSGYGVWVRVFLSGWIGERQEYGDEVRIFDRTHFFPRGSDGEAMVRGYMTHKVAERTPWFVLADWFDDNPDALDTLPESVRRAVGPAFRRFHEDRIEREANAARNRKLQTVGA